METTRSPRCKPCAPGAPKRPNSASAKSWPLFPFPIGAVSSSHLVRKLLEVIGALSSMSGLGNCYANAKAEAFFSTLKAECFPLSNCFQSKAQARSTIFEYIEVYYNNQRLHSALGYKSPRQYESGLSTRKRTTFSKEKITATSSAEGGAKLKRANRINGGSP